MSKEEDNMAQAQAKLDAMKTDILRRSLFVHVAKSVASTSVWCGLVLLLSFGLGINPLDAVFRAGQLAACFGATFVVAMAMLTFTFKGVFALVEKALVEKGS